MTLEPESHDFHCHVDLFPDPVSTIAKCDRDRILTIAVTTTPRAWVQNVAWTKASRHVISALGLHPELVGQFAHEVALFQRLLPETRFVGEIGLDGSPQYLPSLPHQKRIFQTVLAGCQKLGGRVATIHSRRAAKEVVALLARETTPDRVLPILHWFSGTEAMAAKAASLGCYFSINSEMLKSRAGPVLVRSLPLTRLLTETDAPFTRVDNRTAEPHDTITTANALATIRGMGAAEMKLLLRDNAQHVMAFAGFGS